MATTNSRADTVAAAVRPGTTRPPLLSRALLLRFVSIAGASISFYLPLSVTPVLAASAGSHGTAGLATGALLLATVLTELVTPWIATRVGYRWALGGGLFLLGAPALVLIRAAPSIPVIVAVSAVRGIGFAVTVVAGGALTAALIPMQRRGEGLAVTGLVSGVPSLIALPLGLWAAQRFGFAVVFAATAAAPLLALATVPALPARPVASATKHGILRGARTGTLMRPAMTFAASTVAAGALVTALPLAAIPAVAPIALFAQSTTAAAARWVVGRRGDRRGSLTRALVPGVALAILGMAATSVTRSPVPVIAGAVLFGAGFGALHIATLTLMYSRVPVADYGTVSAIWNAAYDLGMGIGAVGVGLVAATTGYPAAFLLTAAAMLPALFIARRDTTAGRS
jgi:MFS family permease